MIERIKKIVLCIGKEQTLQLAVTFDSIRGMANNEKRSYDIVEF